MPNTEIFYIAVAVFILLVIGLGFTVWEFHTHIIEKDDEQANQKKR